MQLKIHLISRNHNLFQMEAEKQKRLEEERKKTEAEARRQRERWATLWGIYCDLFLFRLILLLFFHREQKERERLQKLEQERERKQKEEEERRRKEEMKRKKAEQERIEKEKAEKAAKIKVHYNWELFVKSWQRVFNHNLQYKFFCQWSLQYKTLLCLYDIMPLVSYVFYSV